MVRRRVAAGVGVVLLIVIVLLINGCLKSEKQQSLKSYNRDVSTLAQESDARVSHPLFEALTNATSKSALDVDQQIAQLSIVAKELATRAKGLSVPSEMVNAQRDVLSAFDLRAEAMAKIVELVPKALGGRGKQVSAQIAGEMEVLLASDVIYSQRAAPLIQQTLASNGIQGLTTSSTHFLPNVGWLVASTALARITGQGASGSTTGIAPGTHGSALIGVAVGTNMLAPEPTLNHVSGGGSPTFTVTVEDSGSNSEVDVKVDITVTVGGKTLKASHVINSTTPGNKVNVEIPIAGIPVGAAAKVEVYVEPVPGEADVENNKNTYLAIFGE
jgi:hypothetical protein